MSLRSRWLLFSAFVWALCAYAVWHLGPVGLVFVALGTPLGWALGVYRFVPWQYRYWTKVRKGAWQEDRYWKDVLIGMLAFALGRAVLGQFGTDVRYSLATMAFGIAGTAVLVTALSPKLAVFFREGVERPPVWNGETGQTDGSNDDGSHPEKHHHKNRHRHRS